VRKSDCPETSLHSGLTNALADALIASLLEPGMRSPASPKCMPNCHFGAVALHNRALRIMRVLRFSAIRAIRAGTDWRADARQDVGRPAEGEMGGRVFRCWAMT
jgi:hypothetical protein